MGKPILFDTISRAKFDQLSEDVKKKKNYQIKEDDGKISKYIAGLEGGSGEGGIPIFNVISNVDEEEDVVYTVDASCKDLADAGVFILDLPSGIPITEGGVEEETRSSQKVMIKSNSFSEDGGIAIFTALGISKAHEGQLFSEGENIEFNFPIAQ